MADTRHKDGNWRLVANTDRTLSLDRIQIALLMDLRDELKKLNAVFACHNALDIPKLLRRIVANTAKPRKKRK